MPDLPPLEERRAKLCDCGLCKLAYEVVDFAELLADQTTIDRIIVELEIPEQYQKPEIFLSTLLITAMVEQGFREGASPNWIFDCISVMWNKRTQLAAEGKTRSETEKKLEDYKS